MKFKNLNIKAIEISDYDENIFAAFCEDKKLCACEKNDNTMNILDEFYLENISADSKVIKLYFHYPYICVAENFGINACVINIIDGEIYNISREPYHENVSSYSIGFFDKEGEVFLIHQTKWNRLDITNLKTKALLTDRDVKYKEVSDDGEILAENKNYIDYFHSNIKISPNGKNFISNGWRWSPEDTIITFNIDEFMKSYEVSRRYLDTYCGYNWDRPCTFIDDNILVVVADDISSMLDAEEIENYVYKQFKFYNLNDKSEISLQCYKELDCNFIPLNNYEEAKGKLYFDEKFEKLIFIDNNKTTVIDLDGNIIFTNLDIVNHEHISSEEKSWFYSSKYHFFWTYDDKGIHRIKLEDANK